MKKALIILLVIIIFSGTGLFYLNQVVLPVRLKALVVKGLEDFTQKKVSIQTVRLNIFKGLVLRQVEIYDDKETLLKIKEASCGFFIIPFKWRIVLPWVKIISPELLVKRLPDNSINLVNIFSNKPNINQKESAPKILVSKVAVYSGKIIFRDEALFPSFTKNIEDINAVIYLSLPAKVKFKAKFNILSQKATQFYILGEYNISSQELSAKIDASGLNPKDFNVYYPQLESYLGAGRIDLLTDLKFKGQVLNAKVVAEVKELVLKQDKLLIKFNSGIKADCQYVFVDRKFNYSGTMNIYNTFVSGVPIVDKIDSINADVRFTKAGLNCENFSALVLAFPVKAKINIPDFSNPVLKAQAQTSADLISLLPVLEEKLGITIPAKIKGFARLGLEVTKDLTTSSQPQVNGVLGISQGIVDYNNLVFDNISGKINFDFNQMNWQDFNFRFLDVNYKTIGKLLDFEAPKVSMQLFSDKLNLNTDFNIANKMVNIAKLHAKYLNSDFEVSGSVGMGNAVFTNISLDSNIALNDLRELFKKSPQTFDVLKPSGFMRIQGNLNGDMRNFKNYLVRAKLTSNLLSVYGLRTNNFSLDYNQENGVCDFGNLHLAFYGGSIDANGKINLNSENIPYWIGADITGVKIEELKVDTGLKDKDISGNVNAQFKLNGFSNDISKLSGSGKIMISEGRLWELNLFKGFGALLFTSDFASVVFKQGHCSFTIKDKYIYTDNLRLISNLTNIAGSVKIGFDTSVDATLDAEVSPDVPVSGTLKDITTAILGQAGRFGVIRITGNFKEPKFKFKPAVMDIIKGFKDALFPKD